MGSTVLPYGVGFLLSFGDHHDRVILLAESGGILIRLAMNLAQLLQANLGVLEGANQRDERLYRSGKLAYDIAERHHHAESHPALHHRTSGEEGIAPHGLYNLYHLCNSTNDTNK